ncbi:proteasome assembly chaperone 1 [Anguilla anguilla]|uniref:Proteasome assembly chaperone 1 n=1 Tax=Anguilla anguilla TaxID=7936 RepID=A0A0E9WWF5_ANGAN|nr:proteasome assembly chaperone 1 [Anguilla anguilla]KAG5843886.1 hypothetical protein ANANG_G00155640 [Anguilla anguilla]
MATFFGEVVSAYSRAVEEDEEDVDNENEEDQQIRKEIEQKREVYVSWCPEVTQSITNSPDKTLQCSDFVIAVGPNAAGFLSACILNSGNWVAVGSVSLWNERSKDSSRQPGCVIYRQRDFPKVLICQCTCYIAEDQLFQWTEKVFACIQQRGLNVMVLSDCSMAEYKTPDSLFSSGTPFLRALKTSRYGSQPACLLLEQPNIVTGLAAAVLSHCQVCRIPAVLYQCYSDIINPDSVTMETYKPALSCLSKLIKLDTCLSTDILRKLVPVNEAQSNLYT